MSNELHVYAISDSLGETAYAIAEAASVQFPNADFKIQRYPLIKTVSLVQGILNKAKREAAIIVHTFVDPELSTFVNNYCQENGLSVIDALSDVIQKFSQKRAKNHYKKQGSITILIKNISTGSKPLNLPLPMMMVKTQLAF